MKRFFDYTIYIDSTRQTRFSRESKTTQQSIEKSIKAVLVHFEIAFPLVHDLGILVALVPTQNEPPFGFNLTELNQYATTRRYEEGHFNLTVEELKISLDATLEVLNWAEIIINN